MSSYCINDEEYRTLLEERAKIDARLASLQTTNAAPVSSSQYSRPQVSRQNVPRSFSLAGQSMNRTVSSGRSHHEATLMSASVSQRSAPVIQGGPSPDPLPPFSRTGRIPPPFQPFDGQRDNTVMESWATSQDDPRTTYTIQPRQPVRSLSQRMSDLEQVDEIDSGELPTDYFARIGNMPVFSVTPSPIDIPANGPYRSPTHRGSTSSRRRPSIGITTPSTPCSVALTTATTLASDMSRQSSFCNDAMLGSFEMMNVHSNTSIFTDSNSTDERSYQSSIPFPTSSTYSKLLTSEEQSQLLAGIGRVGEDSQFLQSFHDFEASVAQFSSVPSSVRDMKRSSSNESESSSISAKSRATTQLKRQILLAGSRPIAPAPNPDADEVAMSREGSHTMVSMKSNDGLEHRAVTAIPKAPYQRPKHERVFCTLCIECPEGFRGQHELGRHCDRQHKEHVKKYVCVEPSDGVINSMYRPLNSLAKCKACAHQKKKYGAYYNAAAHLRRAHFKPKQRGRGKCTKTEEKSEKRGGKGGGDWPPMSELKRWMKEVYENVTESQQQDADEEEENEEVDDDDGSAMYEVDDYAKMQDVSNISSINSNFDTGYFYNDAAMLDVYQPQPPNFNTQSMESMPYANLAIPQSVDLSMRTDSSQNSFADSHFASMNDHVTFINPFPQSFPDSFHNIQF